jgi:hypothetical protein
VVGDVVVGASLSTAAQSQDALERRLVGIAPEVRAALSPSQSADDQGVRIEDLRSSAEYWLDDGRPPMAPDRQCLHWPLEFPEIFLSRERPGFDAIVGNPPFQGGQKITTSFGTEYREHLVADIGHGVRGSADLVTYFLLRAAQLVKEGGSIALLATNTIAQGDTREVGLDWLTNNGWSIPRAVKSRPWPGDANLEVAQVWLRRGSLGGSPILDDRPVNGITSALEPSSRVDGRPLGLSVNAKRSFQGSIVLGHGFVLEPETAQVLMAPDARNRDVLFPYLIGDDVNSRPDCSPSRWVINFFDWSLEQAKEFPDCLAIVETKVKPERDRNKRTVRRERWWQFGEQARALYAAIESMERVLVIALTSKTVTPMFVPNGQVFSHSLGVFAYDDDAHFGLLTSAFHYWWAVAHASTLETRIRYTPSDCFETFAQPELTNAIDKRGAALDAHRRRLMLDRREGLTTTYNRVHNSKEDAADIVELRRIHVELDHAVASAYGWEDLDLDHNFWDTRQGVRFTVGPEARVELLDRLLELNHARYAEETALGLHSEKRRIRREVQRQPSESVPALFEVDS